MAIKLADTLAPMADFPAAMAEHIEFEDGKNLQEKFDEGFVSGVELLQSEYDSLTDEEKLNGLKYHCTDTGRIYQNGVLYGEKKPIELTYEEYKQLETDGLVEPDVDYIIIGNESGVLLTSTDVAYSDTLTVKGKFDEVDESVNELDGKIANELKTSQNTGIVNVTLTSNGVFESMGDNYNKYQVRNGVCYFQFFVSSSVATNTFTEICAGLPKPIFSQYFAYPVYYNEQRENKTLQVHISENGTLSASNTLVTTSYMIAGSYAIE